MSSDVRKTPLDPGTPYSRTLKYSIDEKLAIISHAKNHGNRAAGREFNVAESSIREWRKNEIKLIHNKNTAAAGLSSSQSSSSSTTSTTPNHINNNNNNNSNSNKNGNLQNFQNAMIQKIGMENNGFPRRTQEEIMKLQLAHYAQFAMMNMNIDLANLAHLAPLLQLHQQQQQQQQQLSKASSQPTDSTSTSSSVVGTPSSISSASTPPPSMSPVPSGSGRRKPRCPQKIVLVTSSEDGQQQEVSDE